MSTSPNMGLSIWDRDDDPYDHIQLSINFTTLDAHDHTSGRGKRIATLAIQDLAVTTAKLADLSITTAKYANASVTNLKLADDSVNTRVIAPAGVGTTELADRSVTSIKLAEPIRPLGEVIDWWRPTGAMPIPTDWIPCDGRFLGPTEHNFAGGGTIQVPDLRNRFVLGAATGGTGTGPTTPPSIGQVGGSNEANLSHTHTVPHSHTGGSHTHAVNPHSHTVDAHVHVNTSHSHTVDAHAHIVGPHTHNVSAHSHGMDHIHGVEGHSHPIGGDGNHSHFVGGSFIVSRRSYIYPSAAAGLEDRQTLYISGFNAGGASAVASISGEGTHSHGGGTGYAGANTGQTNLNPSRAAGATAESNANFNTANASPGTDTVAGSTQAASPSTSAVATTTGTGLASTSTDSPATTAGLASQDVRPAYVGLLKLIKVKY